MRVADKEVRDTENVINGITQENDPAVATTLWLKLCGEMGICTVAKCNMHPSSEEDVFVDGEHEGYSRTNYR